MVNQCFPLVGPGFREMMGTGGHSNLLGEGVGVGVREVGGLVVGG